MKDTTTTTDVGALLDKGRWSAYQKLLVAATALTIIPDGLDNQLLAASIPALMREWALPRPAFASVLAAALLGMMIGGFTGRLHRRPNRPPPGAARQRHVDRRVDRPLGHNRRNSRAGDHHGPVG